MKARTLVVRNSPAEIDRLVRENLGLVRKVANRVHSPTLGYEDMVSAGNEGLLHAARYFDAARTEKFSFYAGHVIRAFMLNAIQKEWGGITTPEHRKLFFGLRRLRLQDERDPNLIAAALNIRPQIVRDALPHLLYGHVRLDAPIYDDDTVTRQEWVRVAPVDVAAKIDAARDKARIEAAIFVLPERLRVIIRMRFLADPPVILDEVGMVLGLTRERTRQLEVRALQMLRDILSGAEPQRDSRGYIKKRKKREKRVKAVAA